MLFEEWTVAQTFELYGPKNYSTQEIKEIVDKEIIKTRRHINVPKPILKPVAYWLNKLIWWPTMSADEIEMEGMDQKIDATAKTFKDLGIEPAELSNLTFNYLVSHAVLIIGHLTTQMLTLSRWHTGARNILIFLQPQNGRELKRRNTSMCWMTSSRAFCLLDIVYKQLDNSLCFHKQHLFVVHPVMQLIALEFAPTAKIVH